MNMVVGTEAAQLIIWECINGIFVAVCLSILEMRKFRKCLFFAKIALVLCTWRWRDEEQVSQRRQARNPAHRGLSVVWIECTAKTHYRKFETDITRKGIAWPQSQSPCSRVCERDIYSQDMSAHSAAGKLVDQSWEYINRSQTHERGSWDWGRAINYLGMLKWDFRRSVSQHFRNAKISKMPIFR